MDNDAEYQQAKRVAMLAPTLHSRHEAILELPPALDAITARRIAGRVVYSFWLERASFEALLPPDFLRPEPTEVVDVSFPSGASFRVRLGGIEVGADFLIAVQAASLQALSYVSTVTGESGAGPLT